MNKVNLLALSGSLRKASLNTAALNALIEIAPIHIEVTLGSIADLPLFNPDCEGGHVPALAELKTALKQTDGLVIASPEYAHGISGPMKNALDWLVSGDEFPDKPIMLLNTSARAFHAQQALREVLGTMSGRVIDSACVTIPLLGGGFDAEHLEDYDEITVVLQAGLAEFCTAIEALKALGAAD